MSKYLKNIPSFLIIIIATVAFFLRIYNVNWDQFHHVHPDERMITMVAEQIHWPGDQEISSILTPTSPLNPKFFAYGSFPIYLLRIVVGLLSVFDIKFLTYDYINLVGRVISAIFDTLTALFIFRLGKKIKNEKTGILAAVLYTFSVFPIQAAHFYAVDVMLTFFILLTLYFIVEYLDQKNLPTLMKIALALGAALATKVSAILLLLPVIFGLLAVVLFKKKNLKSRTLMLVSSVSLVLFLTGATFAICEPYALIDFQTFWRQTQEQSQMTKNAFTFPYTLQYVATTPYLYHLKNMILWGMGIPLGILSVFGLIFVSCWTMRAVCRKQIKQAQLMIILLSFFWLYFLTVGGFAIKFMRYFLPLYPLFILFAAYMLLLVMDRIKRLKNIIFLVILLTVAYCGIYSISFLIIYSRPHVRVTASNWIINNIPAGSTILREHWDDGMPMWGVEKYNIEELKLYDPDTDFKWQEINGQLQRADYIIIASNRLYTPLQKLVDCDKLPVDRCYKRTTEYYRNLFAGNLGFQKIAEFSSYPTVPLLNIPIDDQAADESFTVYDHPKIMIFKKRI